MEIDLTTVAGIAAVAWGLTSFVLYLFRNYNVTPDAQKLLALGLAIVIALVVYFTGIALQEYSWPSLVLQVIVAAIGAGVTHDKIGKPLYKAMRPQAPP